MDRLRILLAFLLVLSLAVGLDAAEGVPGRPYLALGDSITFGFIANAGFAYLNPGNFIGFPDYLSRSLKFEDVNASCPGETTGSFLSQSAPDNGCRFHRSLVPLHVAYTSTQAKFAVDRELHREYPNRILFPATSFSLARSPASRSFLHPR